MHEFLILSLVRAVNWFDDAIQEGMRAHGYESLTRAESFIILNVSIGERRATSIAKKLGVSRQAISQILQRLEARGLVTITRDATDPRARIVNFSTTTEQAALCERICQTAERELQRRLGKVDVDALRNALNAEWGPVPRIANAWTTPRAKPRATRSLRTGTRAS